MKAQDVDLVVVVDASDSMGPCFGQLRQHLNDLLYPLQQAQFRVRFGLVAYAAGRDRAGPVYDHTFIGGSGPALVQKLYSAQVRTEDYFTSDPSVLTRVVGGLKPQGNEDTLVALDIAADLPFGPVETTRRVIAVFTDEKLEDGIAGEESLAKLPQLIEKLMQRRIQLFVSAPLSQGLEQLAAVDRAEIEAVDGGDGLTSVDFKKLLAQMGKSISVASLQLGREPKWTRALFGQDRVEWMTQYADHQEMSRVVAATRDKFGNLLGPQFDLVTDGAFEGLKIAVLHLYTGGGFDFGLPALALAEKGFEIYRWTTIPSPGALRRELKRVCQLWIVSNNYQMLQPEHLEVIQDFWLSGKGLYLWGDNDPYYADANYVGGKLFGGRLAGNDPGDKVVKRSSGHASTGIMSQHPVCTGVEFLYEGITIATVVANTSLDPILFGSAGNLVVAAYEKDGRKALLDGGFTRLFTKWDSAGTARYVKNAAAWLVNSKHLSHMRPGLARASS
jgi:hypothetical protein